MNNDKQIPYTTAGFGRLFSTITHWLEQASWPYVILNDENERCILATIADSNILFCTDEVRGQVSLCGLTRVVVPADRRHQAAEFMTCMKNVIRVGAIIMDKESGKITIGAAFQLGTAKLSGGLIDKMVESISWQLTHCVPELQAISFDDKSPSDAAKALYELYCGQKTN